MSLRLTIISILLGCSGMLAAQIMGVNQIGPNQAYFNPGATGNLEVLSATFLIHHVANDFPGKPSTQAFSVHAPLKNPAVAMGVMLEHDSHGLTTETGIHLNYAYRLSLGSGKLSLGLRLGIVNGSQIFDQEDSFDPSLDEDNYKYTLPNAGFGVLFTSSNYWVGLSVPRLLGNKSNSEGENQIDFSVYRNEYYISAGGLFNVSSNVGIEPSLLVNYNKTPRIVINSLVVYKNIYKAGLGYSNKNSIMFLLGYNINRQLNFGYCYNLKVGANSVEYGNTPDTDHEVYLQYKFGYKVNASNPRGF